MEKRPEHPRVVIAGGWRGYGRDRRLLFKRWVPRWRVVLREQRRAVCPHPPERYYGSIAADGTHWMGCCVCGKILLEGASFKMAPVSKPKKKGKAA